MRYAGTLRLRRKRRGLEVAETSYRPGQRIDRHVHDRPLVVVVLGGEMTELVGGRSVSCRAGTALFHPAGEPHAHRMEAPGTRCLVATFGRSWLERLGADPELLPDGPVARLDEVVTGAGRLLHAECRRPGGSAGAALDGLALTLLAGLGRTGRPASERHPGWLDRVLERLHDDVAAGVELASLARLAGVTPEHLARTFRERQGCTIGSYVRRLRVERARRELAEGDTPLARLALELGFYDQSHFTRTFKARVGCTPGAYRRRARER